jgi:hypothetical protein
LLRPLRRPRNDEKGCAPASEPWDCFITGCRACGSQLRLTPRGDVFGGVVVIYP